MAAYRIDMLAAPASGDRERMEKKGVRFLDEIHPIGPGVETAFGDSEGNVLRLFEGWKHVKRSIIIDAAPEAAYRALTSAGAMSRWFTMGQNLSLDARVGGRIAFVSPVFGPVDPARRV